MPLENLFWKNFNHFIAEAAKALMPYFEVIQGGLVKRPCDADLVFCSWVLDLKTKIFEKNWRRLTQKMFIDKQLQKEIRSRHLIIFNFANIGIVLASKEAKLIIHIAFFCSK